MDQNEKYFREQVRELEIRKIKARKNQQNLCGHRKSEHGFRPDEDSTLAFHMLKLPTGEVIGVCPYCQKSISSIDPSDKEFFKNVKLYDMAESGQFLLEDSKQLKAEFELGRAQPWRQ